MSHHIYQTEGIVLDSLNSGEANKYLYIFTKDLGLVGATAQSLRKISSKLRYGLQEFSYSDISLVRGKDVWRITNVAPKENLYFQFKNEDKKLFVVSNILTLLKRLLKGEEKNGELFEIVSSAFVFLKTIDVDKEKNIVDDLKNFECIVIMRILDNLGYFAKNEEWREFLQNNDWDEELLLKAESHRTNIIFEINKSLKETHL